MRKDYHMMALYKQLTHASKARRLKEAPEDSNIDAMVAKAKKQLGLDKPAKKEPSTQEPTNDMEPTDTGLDPEADAQAEKERVESDIGTALLQIKDMERASGKLFAKATAVLNNMYGKEPADIDEKMKPWVDALNTLKGVFTSMSKLN